MITLVFDRIENMAGKEENAGELKMITLAFDRVESLVGKEEKLVTSIFPFPTMFSKGLPLGVVKSRD